MQEPQQSPAEQYFFGTLPIGYVAVRKDGVIAQINQAAASALEYEPRDLVGRMAVEFPYDETNRREFLEQMARRSSGHSGAYPLNLRTRTNGRIPVACFAVPYFDTMGGFWGSRGIVVPFGRVSELLTHSGEGNEAIVQRALGGAVLAPPDGPSNGHGITATFTPTDNPFLLSLLPKLTKRERDVVSLLMVGLRVNGVANRLDLSHYTVRNHLKRIFRKAGVNSQGQLLLRLNAP
jgi:DNA-binding CsgD family transcriptional regulator